MRKASSADHAVNWHEARRVAATWLALVVSVATLKVLGFAVSFALLTFFVIAVMYRRPPVAAALIAIASSAGFYVLFPLALGVALPTGVLGF